MSEEQPFRRMQIKVLYSFDNNPTVFLSRSKNQFSVKVAQVPIASMDDQEEMLTLGAFDLRNCVSQVLKSSPENFKLKTEDYAVYYKDVTEQPDEPFVANGVMSALLSTQKPDLIPGRVCQNLSASFLFGDKANSSSLTLEIRLKFHVIEPSAPPKEQEQDRQSQFASTSMSISQQLATVRRKRPMASASNAAVKATRTKSLPIYYNPLNQQITTIINADKQNSAPKYDSKSISERFNSAPFLSAKIIDKPQAKKRRPMAPLTPSVQYSKNLQPQRAMRTRSMMTTSLPMVSSPINEEVLSEATDDTEYNENSRGIEEEEDEEYDTLQGGSSSPYTPQQPPYKPSEVAHRSHSTNIIPSDRDQFHSLPDLEDLDSKKTHTIPSVKLPSNHDLTCINRNCGAQESIMWRYFETNDGHRPVEKLRGKEFDKGVYDGMFGPLCNACYLFLRNKGFMRPEAVVKKYMQQQRYKKDLKSKDPAGQSYSSPLTAQLNQFPTPSHLPSTINEVIRNQQSGQKQNQGHTPASTVVYGQTPNINDDYQDLNDFITQLNSFGGPLTDIDIPDQNNVPPQIATKSNTRVINLCPDEEDKENQPPAKYTDFEQMMIKSFSSKSSPEQNGQSEWSQFFGEPTPKDHTNTPHNNGNQGVTPLLEDYMPPMGKFRSSPNRQPTDKVSAANMPSSPLLTTVGKSSPGSDSGSSPLRKARRVDTTMSYVNGSRSSPQSEVSRIEEKA